MARRSIASSVYVQPGEPVSGQALYRAYNKFGRLNNNNATSSLVDNSGFEDFKSAPLTAAQLADFSNYDAPVNNFKNDSSIKIKNNRSNARSYSIVWDNAEDMATNRANSMMRAQRPLMKHMTHSNTLPNLRPTVQVDRDSHLGVGYDGVLQATNMANDDAKKKEIVTDMVKKEREIQRIRDLERKMKSARGEIITRDNYSRNYTLTEPIARPSISTRSRATSMRQTHSHQPQLPPHVLQSSFPLTAASLVAHKDPTMKMTSHNIKNIHIDNHNAHSLSRTNVNNNELSSIPSQIPSQQVMDNNNNTSRQMYDEQGLGIRNVEELPVEYPIVRRQNYHYSNNNNNRGYEQFSEFEDIDNQSYASTNQPSSRHHSHHHRHHEPRRHHHHHRHNNQTSSSLYGDDIENSGNELSRPYFYDKIANHKPKDAKVAWQWKELVRQMRKEEKELRNGSKTMDPWKQSNFRELIKTENDSRRLIELMELEIQEMTGLPNKKEIMDKVLAKYKREEQERYALMYKQNNSGWNPVQHEISNESFKNLLWYEKDKQKQKTIHADDFEYLLGAL